MVALEGGEAPFVARRWRVGVEHRVHGGHPCQLTLCRLGAHTGRRSWPLPTCAHELQCLEQALVLLPEGGVAGPFGNRRGGLMGYPRQGRMG